MQKKKITLNALFKLLIKCFPNEEFIIDEESYTTNVIYISLSESTSDNFGFLEYNLSSSTIEDICNKWKDRIEFYINNINNIKEGDIDWSDNAYNTYKNLNT